MALHMLPKIAQHGSAPAYAQRTQALIELLKLLLKPLAFRSPIHNEISSATTIHVVRKAEEVEGLWAPLLPTVPGCGTTKPDEPGLTRFDFQFEVRETFSELCQKLSSISLVLKAGDKIITVPHQKRFATTVPSEAFLEPHIQHVVQIDIG
jgi:hypothetical protein